MGLIIVMGVVNRDEFAMTVGLVAGKVDSAAASALGDYLLPGGAASCTNYASIPSRSSSCLLAACATLPGGA